jgi:hypothetical protein
MSSDLPNAPDCTGAAQKLAHIDNAVNTSFSTDRPEDGKF